MAAKRPPNSVETLPDGTEVEYWDAVGVDGLPQQRRYKINGDRYVSISTVSGCLDKPALAPAAVRLTEAGVIELAKRGVNLAGMTPEGLRSAMREHGLHYDSIWDVARDRGDVAHDHMLHLIRDGKVARLSDYPADIRPWISAGMKFNLEAKPKVIAAEFMVASTEHEVAGRCDLFAEMRDGRKARIDFKTVSEWKCKTAQRNGEKVVTDQLLPPYDENLIQISGYELTATDCGYEDADVLMVVRLGPDGGYDITEVPYRPDAFLAVLGAYRAKRGLLKPQAVAA